MVMQGYGQTKGKLKAFSTVTTSADQIIKTIIRKIM
jgi:hypothetical protein